MRSLGTTIAAAAVIALLAVPWVSAQPRSARPVVRTAAPNVPYTGPERGLKQTLAEPKKKAGYHFTVGYMTPNASILALSIQQKAAIKEIEKLGGRVIVKDANFDITTQVNQFNDLIVQKVNAILLYPLDPASLGPSIAKANAAHIPIIAEGAPQNAGKPNVKGIVTNILTGFDMTTYGRAAAVAGAAPGSSFAILGNAAPVEALQYEQARLKYWGKKFGLKFVGEVDTQQDTPAGAAQAMAALLAKYPSVHTVITYNDQSALAGANQARSQGNKKVWVIGNNGEPTAIAAVKTGLLWGTYNTGLTELGTNLAIAAYDVLTKQHLPLPAKVTSPGEMVTKANASKVTPLG